MKTMTTVALSLATLVAGTSAQAIDLTTCNGGPHARYVANYAGTWGETTRQNVGFSGIVDFASMVQGGTASWQLNDGNDGSYMTTYGGKSPDFIGYRFKLPTKNVTSLRWVNVRGFWDGGSFAAAPKVQYLTDPKGAWITIPDAELSWDQPYDIAYGAANAVYNITFNPPLAHVWGLRIIGDANPSPPETGDPDGFIGVGEFTVYGELDTGTIDFTRNMALGETGIANFLSGWSPATSALTDGLFDEFDSGATKSYGSRDSEDFIGVLFATKQLNVSAVGVGFQWYNDGGIFEDSCVHPLRIEYTKDGGMTWTAVTGLDTGRYRDEWTSIAVNIGWNPRTDWLFRFDEVDDIDGLRIIGTPAGRGGDTNGFVTGYEFEVFGVPTKAALIDFNNDNVIDIQDVQQFTDCFSGPKIPFAPTCKDYDLDTDGDIDQADFGIVQKCYSGSALYDPRCGD